jgi:ankyrin repeat protein
VNARDNEGAVPLHKASFYGHREVIEHLLESGANVDEQDNDKATPLHKAAFKVPLYPFVLCCII